jgi:ankyrin repeat protein
MNIFKSNIDLNLTDENGNTVIMIATIVGNTKILNYLLNIQRDKISINY